MADSHLSFFPHLFFIKDSFVYLILICVMNCNWPLCNMIHKEIESISPPLKADLQYVICFSQKDISKCDIGKGRSTCLM